MQRKVGGSPRRRKHPNLFVVCRIRGERISESRSTYPIKMLKMLKGVKEWHFLKEVKFFECKREKYNNLLEQIIRVLDELNDLERLISICRGHITDGRRASIHDVRSLFRELERNGSLGIDCLEILKEILIQMEKSDLLEKVNQLERGRFIDVSGIGSVDFADVSVALFFV